ncbi:E3 ubiquitin-protein ligase MIB2-like isoform X2 [Octopus sinensis]|uniref:E3 ubiquitin-protein ligase MIB2-like isoform X2 n=1 Tax=Octopus sinensis TaxID=2607531 RepID=A0A6P7U7T2_9MOLL|nr:E3 ubiquitin-protein ligase MIB2-like isoform X2 [Octopus sinensis]
MFGNTPLHLAVNSSTEWTDGVKAIMNQSAVEVNPRNEDGQTPLHWACDQGYLHTVDLLLGHNGIDANVVDNDGDTPLHVAVQQRKYIVVCAMLKQDSVNLEIVNKEYRTPLLEAVSDGHLGIMQRLIARGTNVNVVEHGGNNCLHLALKRKNNFHSEVEHMTMLDQFCVELKLGNEERCSGVVVASYLAHHGANFYCKNKSGRTPLDLIEKENLKKMLKTLFSPQCVFCEDEVATETFFPCKHLSLCKKCCPQKIPKRCPMCRQNITSKNSLEGPKSSKPEVQMLAEPPVNRTFEVKEIQKLTEPVEAPTHGKFSKVSEPTSSTTKPVESPVLDEKFLQDVAQNLGGKWQQVGRELGIKTVRLEIIKNDNPLDTVEQSFQMLRRWFTTCDPETRTHRTLGEALEKFECFDALECLPHMM